MNIDPAALHKLLAWTSPGYPIGAFSYSHGLEQAVEDGAVTCASELADYVAAALERGCGLIDAAMFAHAWRAAGDKRLLEEIADEAAAWRATSELALESRQQGAAFLLATRRAWPHPALDAFAAARMGKPTPHAVVAGLACAIHDVPLIAGLEAFLHGFAANLASAGVRLVPLGQSDGQIVLAQLWTCISAVAQAALAVERADLGTSACRLDLFSMHHETQYTRLFRS